MPISNNTQQVLAGRWLQAKALEQRPIGLLIDLNPVSGSYRVRAADLLPDDEVDFYGQTGDAGCGILTNALSVWATKLSFVAPSMPQAITNLRLLTGIPARSLVERCLGDLAAIEATLGLLSDDITAREALRQWRGCETMPMPSYYNAIAKPLQRAKAQGFVQAGFGWDVSYSELWLRVVAFYSHDPQLMQALMQDDYPPQAYLTTQLQGLYNDVTHETAFACLLFTVLGGDLPYMEMAYPAYAEQVKALGDLEVLGHHLDKMIPSIRLMATGLSTVPATGYFETMYGRRKAYRASTRMPMPGEYLDHIIMGTVCDLVNILCVTMINQGATVDIHAINPLNHSIRVVGATQEHDVLYFLGQLRQLATLAAPLAPIPLGASVGRHDATQEED